MITVQAKSPSPGSYSTTKWTTKTRQIRLWRGLRARHSPRRKSQLGLGLVSDSWVRADWLPNSDCLTEANCASLYRVISGGSLRMRADTEPYPPASVVGAIILPRLGIPPGCHALDIEAVGLVTGQLDRLPSRGEYRKVIRCDTCTAEYTAKGHPFLTIFEHLS